MASTAIYRTLSQNYGTGGGITTISFWFKRAKLGVAQCLTSSYYSVSYYGQFQIGSNDQLTIQDWRASNVYSKTTNMVFRDTSSWYHVCWSFNNRTGGSSSSNLWINGELITSWSSETEYSYQATTSWNTDYTHYIGCLNTSASQAYFDGLISDYYFIQGQAYNASTFGETDATTGIWKPKTSPTIDYSGTGNNSCHLKFENSSNMDLDSGDNNLTFTTSGNLIQTVDTPSNVFATMNPLDNYYFGGTFTNGNNTVLSGSSSYSYCSSTMHVSKGKWYCEVKGVSVAPAMRLGIGSKIATSASDNLGNDTDGEAALYPSGSIKVDNVDNPNSWSGTSWTDNDIIGIAMDLDNNKLYFAKNGTWMNSADPSAGTGGINITAPASTSTGAYFIGWGDNWNAGTATMSHNFGNGYFGTTAVSSATSDESGLGIFEYTVPSGYYALCTKNINEQEYD